MLWSVAGRFHFSSAELWSMPLTRLEFWYRGHAWMHGEDIAAVEAAKAALLAGRGGR